MRRNENLLLVFLLNILLSLKKSKQHEYSDSAHQKAGVLVGTYCSLVHSQALLFSHAHQFRSKRNKTLCERDHLARGSRMDSFAYTSIVLSGQILMNRGRLL